MYHSFYAAIWDAVSTTLMLSAFSFGNNIKLALENLAGQLLFGMLFLIITKGSKNAQSKSDYGFFCHLFVS